MNFKICLFPFVILSLNGLKANELNDDLLNLSYDQISGKSLLKDFEADLPQIMTLETIALRGLNLLFMEQFEDALADFNHILDVLYDSHRINDPLFGTAIWGRLLCHAYANQEKEAFDDLSYVRSYFIDIACPPCIKSTVYNDLSLSGDHAYLVYPIEDFANPREKLTSSECRNRVKGTANVMRLLCSKIPNRGLADAVRFTISELEYAAYQCCDRSHWTECLSPVIDSWDYLKNCMDKGLAIAPKLAGPGR